MTDDPTRLAGDVDAVLLDVGGTLVDEAAAGTAVSDLVATARPGVADALPALLPAVTDLSYLSGAHAGVSAARR